MVKDDFAPRHAAVLFLDLVEHAEKTKNEDALILQTVAKALKKMLEEMLERFPYFGFNFTGDGALLLFDSSDLAAQFCLNIRREWTEKMSALRKQSEIPIALELDFRASLHHGQVYPLDFEVKGRRDYVSHDIIIASRILGEAKTGEILVTDTFVDSLQTSGFNCTVFKENVILHADRRGNRTLYTLEEKGENPDVQEAVESALAEQKTESKTGKERLVMPAITADSSKPGLGLVYFLNAQSLIGTDEEFSEKQILLYELAIRHGYRDYGAYNNLGVALNKLGNYDDAIDAYDQALRLKPDMAYAHSNRGFALANKGDLDAAKAAYNEAICINPDLADAHLGMGLILAKEDKYDAAIGALMEAIRIMPDNADAYCGLGATLAMKRDFDAAIRALKEAIRLKPNSSEAHGVLGTAFADKGEYDAAIAAFDDAIRLNPNDAATYLGRGVALAKIGELGAAIADYDEAVRIKPDFAEAHYILACAYARSGKDDDAIAELETAIKLDAKYRDMARTDAAFDSLRDNPEFMKLLG